MKVTSAFNGFTTIVILGIIVVLCLAESSADIKQRNSGDNTTPETIGATRTKKSNSCLQYGHSCWGGHGKRQMPKEFQRQAPISDDWSLLKALYPSFRRSPLSEMAFILNRSPVEVANEIAMLRRAANLGNSDDGNERRNINSENNEEQVAPRNMYYLSDQAADSDNNLLQILNDNDAV
ncbi:neuropeptide CCHamide 1 [Arctopsyche grandis]|uniref:neuropeptide CCHamide 1 n=1 Tax=Arctopsyche grandis TaxID=121162 RepID=UPI00406DA47B